MTIAGTPTVRRWNGTALPRGEPGYDYEAGGGQGRFVALETRLVCVGHDGGTHSSRSRNSSDSSPSFVSVDSKRRVEGGPGANSSARPRRAVPSESVRTRNAPPHGRA